MLGLFPSTGSSAFWEVFVLIPRSLSSTRAILVLILCGMAFIYVFIFFFKKILFGMCTSVLPLCLSVRTTSWISWNLESQMVMSHLMWPPVSLLSALSHWPISLDPVFHSFVYFYIITWIGLSVERNLFSYLAAIELATVTLCSPPPPRGYHPIHVRSCPWKLHTASGDEACEGPVEAWCLGSTSYCSCSPFRGRAEATALALGWPCILAICSFCPWLLKHLFCWLLKCLHIVGNLNIA